MCRTKTSATKHKHLSITVQEDGQIQQLSETEAGFRLASISTAPLPRDRGVAAYGGASANPAAIPPAAAAAKPKGLRSRGSSIARSHKPAGRRRPAPAATTVGQGAPSSRPLFAPILPGTRA